MAQPSLSRRNWHAHLVRMSDEEQKRVMSAAPGMDPSSRASGAPALNPSSEEFIPSCVGALATDSSDQKIERGVSAAKPATLRAKSGAMGSKMAWAENQAC